MVTALVLSGGTGTRLGSAIPKQYIEVNNKPIIVYCLEQLYKNDNIDKIHIVADYAWQDSIKGWIDDYGISNKFADFSEPGVTRQLSIYNGLVDISKYSSVDDYVFIHDAARPLLSQNMIDSCINALDGYEGVIPVLPMKDTVYLSDDGKTVTSLLDRSKVYAGQAPEVFILGKYLKANRSLIKYTDNDCKVIDAKSQIMKINGSTEPAVMAGMNIAMIPGDERNYKITTNEDLERFKRYESMEA